MYARRLSLALVLGLGACGGGAPDATGLWTGGCELPLALGVDTGADDTGVALTEPTGWSLDLTETSGGIEGTAVSTLGGPEPETAGVSGERSGAELHLVLDLPAPEGSVTFVVELLLTQDEDTLGGPLTVAGTEWGSCTFSR